MRKALWKVLWLAWLIPMVLLAHSALFSTSAHAVEYEIYKISPHSWAHYYQLIGLGTVLMFPLPEVLEAQVEAHCEFLTENTRMPWLPLGVSAERGYRLCYREGPYTTKQVTLFCARLQMGLKAHTPERIVCESTQGPVKPEIPGYSVE